MEPHKLTRGHLALSEQEAAKDSPLNTYHINGMEVSEDPAEAVEALEIEIASIRYAYPNIEHSLLLLPAGRLALLQVLGVTSRLCALLQ